MKIPILLFTVAALLICQGIRSEASEDTVVARGFVNKRTVLIGDRVRYAIETRNAKSVDVEFPAFADKKIGDFEVKDSGRKLKEGFFGMVVETRWYDIASYKIGKHTIPEAIIKYGPKGKTDKKSASVKPLDIAVESVLPKGMAISDIKDIKGPIVIPEMLKIIVIIFTGLIIVIVLAAAYAKFLKRKPVKLAHETAIEELESHKGIYARAGDVKLYYVGISDSVRRYIERVFRMRAPEMTTEEFLMSLASSSVLSTDEKSRLREFLSSCDLVKFAKYAPDKAETDSVFTTARNFIEETKDVHV